MFVLADEYTFTWPTVIRVPADGGGFDDHLVDVTFRALDQDRADELLRREDKDFLREVVRHITPVCDSAGNEIPYSAELLERLLKKAFVRTALIRTYFEAVSGVARKNSKTPPAAG